MSSDHVIYQSAKTWQYGLWKAIFVDRYATFHCCLSYWWLLCATTVVYIVIHQYNVHTSDLLISFKC
jgi:hypothetical protein